MIDYEKSNNGTTLAIALLQMHEIGCTTIPTKIVLISMHIQNLAKIYQFVLKPNYDGRTE